MDSSGQNGPSTQISPAEPLRIIKLSIFGGWCNLFTVGKLTEPFGSLSVFGNAFYGSNRTKFLTSFHNIPLIC